MQFVYLTKVAHHWTVVAEQANWRRLFAYPPWVALPTAEPRWSPRDLLTRRGLLTGRPARQTGAISDELTIAARIGRIAAHASRAFGRHEPGMLRRAIANNATST